MLFHGSPTFVVLAMRSKLIQFMPDRRFISAFGLPKESLLSGLCNKMRAVCALGARLTAPLASKACLPMFSQGMVNLERFASTEARGPQRFNRRNDRAGSRSSGPRNPSSTDKNFSLDDASDGEPVAAVISTRKAAEERAPVLPIPSTAEAGPLVDTVITPDGKVLAIDDATSQPSDSASITRADRRNKIKNFLYYRRNLRATYDSDDFEDYTLAATRAAEQLEDEDIDSIVRPTDYHFGEDPLQRESEAYACATTEDFLGFHYMLYTAETKLPFDIRQVRMTTFMTLDAAPNTKRLDRRASLECYIGKLGLDPVVAKYVRAIAGPHYNAKTDVMKISSDSHADAASNRRKILEQLVALVQQGETLSAKFGDFKPHVTFPRYR